MTADGTSPDIHVDPGELEVHAGKLNDIHARMGTALQAAGETIHPEAFGQLGIPLAAICSIAQTFAAEAIGSASESAQDHVKRVQDWKQHRELTEEGISKIFKVED